MEPTTAPAELLVRRLDVDREAELIAGPRERALHQPLELWPGNPTLPDLLSTRYRFDHNDGLEAADRAAQRGEVDVSQLESVLETALKQQLSAV